VLRLLQRRPGDLRLAGEVEWKQNAVLRGVRKLPLDFPAGVGVVGVGA
jgi:hypothetical protein